MLSMVCSYQENSIVHGWSDLRTDALTKIGHACGHNLIAIVSLGGALAAAKALEDEALGGKVVLFGTPAEGRFPDL